MPELFSYLIKINVAIAMFYCGYFFFLKKLTFYSLNRFYLLFAVLFSAVFPLISLPAMFSKPDVVLYSFHQIESSLEFIPQGHDTQSYVWLGFSVLYWGVMAFLILKFVIRLFSLYRIHRASSLQYWNGYTFRNLKEESAPFSFFGTIYLNMNLHNAQELITILQHEKKHTQGLHTFDVLLAELWSLFTWFNPVSWRLNKAIKVNIEFIADREVVMQGVSQKQYQYSLVHFATQSSHIPLTNQFSFLSLKTRIAMMNKRESSKRQLGMYFILVPLIIASLLIFGVSKAYDGGLTVDFLEKTEANEIGIQEEVHEPVVVEGYPIKKVENSQMRDSIQKINGSPLFVIDGIVQEKSNEAQQLDPNNIESVTVLKNESANELYPGRGKDGVILISTKSKSRIEIPYNQDLVIEGSPSLKQEMDLKDITPKVDSTPPARVVFQDGKVAGLYFVDGEQVDQATMEKLNTNQIDSIHVLKGGPSVISIYGSRAKNGVVKITTKK